MELRPREFIRHPGGLIYGLEQDHPRQIAQVKRRRSGKKSQITKRIKEIVNIVNSRGSRTKVSFLKGTLIDTLQEAIHYHEELMQLLDEDDKEFNDDWIDNLSLEVNTCLADIDIYLKERENDPPSEFSEFSFGIKQMHNQYYKSGHSFARAGEIDRWRSQVSEASAEHETLEKESCCAYTQGSLSGEEESKMTKAFSRLSMKEEEAASIIRSRPLIRSSSMPDIIEKIPNNIYQSTHREKFTPKMCELTNHASHHERSIIRGEPLLPNYIPYKDNEPAREKYDNVFGEKLPQQKSCLNTLDKMCYDRKLKVSAMSKMHDRSRDVTFKHAHPATNVIRKMAPPTFATESRSINYKPIVETKEIKHNSLTSLETNPRSERKSTDSWIKELKKKEPETCDRLYPQDISMQMLIQQSLPRQTIPVFDGLPENWIDFISKFHDMVHSQAFLSDYQKQTYLLQHLKGEPLKAVQGYGNDSDGYLKSLERLKYMFGDQSLVAQATIKKITKGKAIADNDTTGLTDYYYALSSCLNTLDKMCYDADINSSDVLRQALRRLPVRLLRKWSEYSFNLRRREQPTLRHLERWLQDRIMAAKDPFLPDLGSKSKHAPYDKTKTLSALHTRQENMKKYVKSGGERKCLCCGEKHAIYKCSKYKDMKSQQRIAFVKSKNACFNCLQPEHSVRKCESKHTCFIKGCSQKHHTTLHEALIKKIPFDKTNGKNNNGKQSEVEKEDDKLVGIVRSNRHVYLQVVPIRLHNTNGKFVDTYALLDCGSQCTIIRKETAKELNLSGNKERISISTIKDKGQSITTKRVSFILSSRDGTFKEDVQNAYSVNSDNFNVPSQHIPKDVKKDKRWKFIDGLNISNIQENQISVLIGADIPKALISTEVKFGGPGLPYASKTKFGWALIGVHENVSQVSKKQPKTIGKLEIKPDDKLHDMVSEFWSTENFGTEFKESHATSVKDRATLELLDKETTSSNGHYHVPMLWKREINLPESLPMAEKRLAYLSKKFLKDEAYYTLYKKNIEEYVEKGYARKLPDEEINMETEKTWYLPHHGVTNPNKPGKVRTVFDAAARAGGRSLNDNLITGPDLLNNLIGILLRFRKYHYAVIADIEAMFHQVRLKKEDTESVRFLWKDNMVSDQTPSHYQMLVHIFGAKDSACCSSYALRRTAVDLNKEFPGHVAQTVLQDFYMDDLIKSVNSEMEAKELVQLLPKMLKEGGGFNLTKFNSNSDEVLKSVPPEKRVNGKAELTFEDSEVTRALGVKWELKSDVFLYTTLPKQEEATKRGILKVTASIFDPLGLLTPFVLKAKILIQELWRRKCDWDQEIDEGIHQLWSKWIEELQELQRIRIPRCIYYDENLKAQLHVFCDASELAFAAVSYVRIEKPDNVYCHLLFSKSRLAPLKTLTIPRLELQGAVLGIRLKEIILEETKIQFDSIHFWTDSMINLQYINNEDKRFKVFVSNRVAEIRKHSDPSQWRHVESGNNPADIATRGSSPEELNSNPTWFKGPKFLYDDENQWISLPVQGLKSEDCEIKTDHLIGSTVKTPSLIEFEDFSSWSRLVNILSWISVFITNLKNKSSEDPPLKTVPSLTLEQTAHGTTILFQLIQKESFQPEIDQLKKGKSVPSNSPLKILDPFLDEDGIIRVGGRLKYGLIPYAAKHQIILPAKHHAVKLLIINYHKTYLHVGREHLLALLRQKFWILKSRSILRQLLYKCVACQKRKPKFLEAKMANLPKQRIAIASPPFYHTGVDYFGPINVKILRSRTKRWGCIFTCLTTRAIHLEVAPSLETDAFLNVLERFINRRGYPSTIHSDCGTNFKGADRELRDQLRCMDHNQLETFAHRKGFKWIFNPPESPHMGGAWERLIKSVKISLKVILSNRLVDDYTLTTLFTGVEALINSRPLTYVSDDINDVEPLTPSHFLIGRANMNLTPCLVYESDTDHRKRWKQSQALTNQFWKRWTQEYLPKLQPRAKWTTGNDNLKEGDMVVMTDSKTPRGEWPLARITKVMPSEDGLVRSVEIKTKDGTYVRPITKLARLSV